MNRKVEKKIVFYIKRRVHYLDFGLNKEEGKGNKCHTWKNGRFLWKSLKKRWKTRKCLLDCLFTPFFIRISWCTWLFSNLYTGWISRMLHFFIFHIGCLLYLWCGFRWCIYIKDKIKHFMNIDDLPDADISEVPNPLMGNSSFDTILL